MKKLLGTFKSARWIELMLAALVVCVLLLFMLEERESIPTTLEERMEEILSSIDGAGEVQVMLGEGGAVVSVSGSRDFSVMLALQRSVQTLTGLQLSQIEIIMPDGGEG